MEAFPREIEAYARDDGSSPFQEWIEGLDFKTRAIILKRIERVSKGNFGDCEAVGDGVFELRFDVGPGYRVYFGQVDKTVYLISGGTKRNQQKDIEAAKTLWRNHD